ncbi:MAG: replicative DNA helicase [Gammaproteobacteria bacterium]|nr:MAG: replicative DNA helicase [Gammaproteobacteria bacterium]
MPESNQIAMDQDVASIKSPPYSLEAEQSILGGIMLNNEAWDDVGERVAEKDFFRHNHQVIFGIMGILAEARDPLDVVTLSEALDQRQLLEEVGGIAYLGELANNTPSAANIAAYANIVRERSVFRQLISVANEIADLGYNPNGQTSDEVMDIAERKVFEIAESGAKSEGGPEGIKPLLARAVDRIDALYTSGGAMTGISTGFTDLDEMTSGLQPADLVIVAGRPSMGKTTFAMNVGENALIQSGLPILVFSMEMPSESIVTRMLSSLGRIDQTRLRNGRLEDEDWPRLNSAISLLADQKLFVDDSPALSPLEVRARARRVVREHGQLGMIIIDYLQLMQVPGSESRVNEVSEISRSLKALAKELNCPVVALSQLNRGLEQRPDKRPVMSDLRESGAIEQDADVIMFIYRDEVYNRDDNNPLKGTAEIIIGKQRNGPIGNVKLAFLGKYTKFEDLSPDAYGAFESE